MRTEENNGNCCLTQVIEKPPETGDLILKAIEHSILFKNCGKGDLAQLVEAFAPVNFPEGAQVITQVKHSRCPPPPVLFVPFPLTTPTIVISTAEGG